MPCGIPLCAAAQRKHPGEVKAGPKRSSSRPLRRQFTMGEQPDTGPFEGGCRRTKAAIGYSDQIAGSERTIQLDLKWVRWEAYSAVKLFDDLAGESPASANYPVGTVVISGDGEGDQTVGSPEVNVLVGWMKIWSAPTGGQIKQQVVA